MQRLPLVRKEDIMDARLADDPARGRILEIQVRSLPGPAIRELNRMGVGAVLSGGVLASQGLYSVSALMDEGTPVTDAVGASLRSMGLKTGDEPVGVSDEPVETDIGLDDVEELTKAGVGGIRFLSPRRIEPDDILSVSRQEDPASDNDVIVVEVDELSGIPLGTQERINRTRAVNTGLGYFTEEAQQTIRERLGVQDYRGFSKIRVQEAGAWD